MLVANINAVKVESVPLKFTFFVEAVRTMGKDAQCPAHRCLRRVRPSDRDELHNVGGPGHAADAVEDVASGRW
jgi:hypothetical protein